MTDTLQFALDYWDRGWPVIPVRGKRPVVTWRAYQKKRPELEKIKEQVANSVPENRDSGKAGRLLKNIPKFHFHSISAGRRRTVRRQPGKNFHLLTAR